MTPISTPRIAIIGLGYVGLPLAVEFGKMPAGRRLRHQAAAHR
jgi:UDP-N-acetyl-D-mannosaminuronate dehydrogenase